MSCKFKMTIADAVGESLVTNGWGSVEDIENGLSLVARK